MKKTFNINVAGFPFTIDEDAYALLRDYLDTIERAFRNHEDSQELITDIESRVAELLLERTGDQNTIITAEDVAAVIRRVGKPEEMITEEETITVTEGPDSETIETEETVNDGSTPPPFMAKVPPVRKKLYRDPQTGMIGGVCSGIAWYLNCDPTWVRLAAVLLTIASLSAGLVLYIILWIVLPEPRTPLERMQMMGEQPTVENIGKTVTDNFMEEKGERINDPRATASPVADGMARTFGLVTKIFIIIGLIIGIPILIALSIGLIGCVFVLIMYATANIFGVVFPWGPSGSYESQILKWGVICGIGAILALGSPIFFLVRKGLSKKPLTSSGAIALSILCAAGFLTAAAATGVLVSENARDESERQNRYEIERRAEENSENNTTWIEEDWQDIDSSTEDQNKNSSLPVDSTATDSIAKPVHNK